MRFYIPIRLVSFLNERFHWRKLNQIKNRQKEATRLSMIGKEIPLPPLIITITRVGKRRLDDDNLATSCKYVRDQIAEIVGVDDGSSLYTWQYRQRTSADEQYGVEVEITTRDHIAAG